MNIDDRRDKPLSQLAKEAIQIQDASNLRGVLLAWHKAICQDCVIRGGQVEEFLNILYLGKVCSLMRADGSSFGDAKAYVRGTDDVTTWEMAYEWARKVAQNE